MSNVSAASAGNRFLQVSADAERARAAAGQDDCMDAVVVVGSFESAAKIFIHRQGQRVELFRPVDPDRRDMPILGQINGHLDGPTDLELTHFLK